MPTPVPPPVTGPVKVFSHGNVAQPTQPSVCDNHMICPLSLLPFRHAPSYSPTCNSSGRSPSIVSDADGTNDARDSRGCAHDRLHRGAFEVCTDLSGQIHDPIESLHSDEFGRSQCRIPPEQRSNIGRDLCVTKATGESALAVRRACRKRTGENDGEHQYADCTACVHVRRFAPIEP